MMKMAKNIRFFTFFSLFALMLISFWLPLQALELEPLAIISGSEKHTFHVEIANTPQSRERGVMYRKSLPDDGGMLFMMDESVPIHMWMKNTFIPLDMVFIHEDGRIGHIIRNAVPHSTEVIGYEEPAKAVLELPGGTVNKYHIAVGDWVHYPAFQK